jgi:hypothetical protein
MLMHRYIDIDDPVICYGWTQLDFSFSVLQIWANRAAEVCWY